MTTVSYQLRKLFGTDGNVLALGTADVVAASGNGNLLLVDDVAYQGVAKLLDPALKTLHHATAIDPDASRVYGAVALRNGSYAVTYADGTGDGKVHARLIGADGVPAGATITIDPSATATESEGAIASLSNGGFVVAYSKDYGGGDVDLGYEVFGPGGGVKSAAAPVDSDSSVATFGSSVAGLKNGGFVVAFTQEDVGSNTESLYFQLYDNNNAAIGTKVAADTIGSVKENIHALGLADGGFALVYQDDGWDGGASGPDITLALYKADGSGRANVRVNSYDGFDNGGDTDGDQRAPTVTQLKNGDIVVGWESFDVAKQTNNINARVFDIYGNALTEITKLATSVYEIDTAFATQLYDGFTATWSSTQSGKDVIKGGQVDLQRTSVGTNQGETITGDDLVDAMYGQGGTDSLNGLGGNDRLYGGDAKDYLYGGDGNDILNGGTGDDFLEGEVSADTLTGGTGRDKFELSGYAADRITDFAHGTDKIGLAGSAYHDKLGTAVDKSEFRIGTAAQDANDYLIFNQSTGALYFDSDGNGAKAQQQIAQLAKNLPLANTDFEVDFF